MKKQLLSIVLATGLLQGCLSDDSSESSQLSLSITDAAIDFAAKVEIEVNGIEIHSNDGTYTFEFENTRTINLLDLQGSQSESLLTNETVPAGEYQWVRLMVETATITLTEGLTIPLTIPSSDQTGYKLVGGFTLPAHGSADFTLDFDVRKSVTVTGAGSYKMKPTMRMVNNIEVGHIAGNVDGSLLTANCDVNASLAVYAYEGLDATTGDEGSTDAPVASSLVDENFDYEIGFLTQGEYTIALTCNADSDDVEVAGDDLEFVHTANVSVDSKNTASFDFELSVSL